MGYYDVDIICDGALEISETFPDDPESIRTMELWLMRQEREAKAAIGVVSEVYILHHDHDYDLIGEIAEDECSCVQYVTDHKPEYTWTGGGE